MMIYIYLYFKFLDIDTYTYHWYYKIREITREIILKKEYCTYLFWKLKIFLNKFLIYISLLTRRTRKNGMVERVFITFIRKMASLWILFTELFEPFKSLPFTRRHSCLRYVDASARIAAWEARCDWGIIGEVIWMFSEEFSSLPTCFTGFKRWEVTFFVLPGFSCSSWFWIIWNIIGFIVSHMQWDMWNLIINILKYILRKM